MVQVQQERKCRECGSVERLKSTENICYPCNYEYLRRWRKANPDKVRGYTKKRMAAKEKFYAEKRAQHLKSKFGLTEADYQKIRQHQDGACAICGRKKDGFWHHSLVIDHCHASGKVRGLLCNRCNIHLGWYEQQLENIKRYMEQS